MKLFAGIAVAFSLLIQADDVPRPEPVFTVGTTFFYTGEFDFTKLKKQKYSTWIHVTGVQRSGPNRFCNATMTNAYDDVETNSSYLLQFASDSLNFYVIAQNFCYRELENVKKGIDNTSGDSLIYPFNMKVGDTLPNAWAKTQINNSEGTTVGLMEFTKRSVEAVDTLKLPFGSIPAYRIVYLKVLSAKVNSRYSGKREEKDYVTVTEWFSPQLGIVRTLEKSANSVTSTSLDSYRQE